MDHFTVKERRVGDVVILSIYGKLKGCGGRVKLRESIDHAIKDGHDQILLNFAHVSDIDSSCLGEFVSSAAELTQKGVKMKLSNLSEKLRDVMKITNLLSVFSIYEDEEDALDTFMSDTLDPDKQNVLSEHLKNAPLGRQLK